MPALGASSAYYDPDTALAVPPPDVDYGAYLASYAHLQAQQQHQAAMMQGHAHAHDGGGHGHYTFADGGVGVGGVGVGVGHGGMGPGYEGAVPQALSPEEMSFYYGADFQQQQQPGQQQTFDFVPHYGAPQYTHPQEYAHPHHQQQQQQQQQQAPRRKSVPIVTQQPSQRE